MPRFGERLEMLKDVPRLLATNMPSAINGQRLGYCVRPSSPEQLRWSRQLCSDITRIVSFDVRCATALR